MCPVRCLLSAAAGDSSPTHAQHTDPAVPPASALVVPALAPRAVLTQPTQPFFLLALLATLREAGVGRPPLPTARESCRSVEREPASLCCILWRSRSFLRRASYCVFRAHAGWGEERGGEESDATGGVGRKESDEKDMTLGQKGGEERVIRSGGAKECRGGEEGRRTC